MSYEHETEANFRRAEAQYELEQAARERRTDPVYAMRRTPPTATTTIRGLKSDPLPERGRPYPDKYRDY